MNFKAIIYNNDELNPGWILFENPIEIIVVSSTDEIINSLSKIELLTKNGYFAVGYIGYEASSGFDTVLKVKKSRFPLMMFGIYEGYDSVSLPEFDNYLLPNLISNINEADYEYNIHQVKEYIAAGDTYQVNFTYKLNGAFSGEPVQLFSYLYNSQPSIYSTFLQCDDFAIVSVSPELFFRKDGNKIICKPMKGTAHRECVNENDIKMAQWLQDSEKNRAENLMIVDMVRNDLGKIAEIGSINTELFKIEKYPSVWQMISNVSAITNASLVEIFTALFPSASITGAPKVRTMDIINELENESREVYTGTIGMIKPDGDAIFNVAIRTALIDLINGVIEYGVGGGITWDSTVDDELQETVNKSLVITSHSKQFSLFETMLWSKDEGIFLEKYHLRRLVNSADYFSFKFSLDDLRADLSELVFPHDKAIIRVELNKNGLIKIEIKNYPERKNSNWRVKVSSFNVNSKDKMFYHKTTSRYFYENSRKQHPDFDDVIFKNELGEVTESTIANVVIEKDGRLYTPTVKCGLLNGTFRQYLLDTGQIIESVITVNELMKADKVYLINSVREWIPVDVYPADY
jgi:para-aminobenzoate synthetase/4-amino-4-deoxychorismate lyase